MLRLKSGVQNPGRNFLLNCPMSKPIKPNARARHIKSKCSSLRTLTGTCTWQYPLTMAAFPPHSGR